MGAEQHHAFPLAGQVVLAHVGPFELGHLRVDPPRRQVQSADQSEILEPRVMQVLVALARANGAIVTRDELIESCWDGRIVGDDAVNRALSRLRRLATGIGQGSISVETISRVGYRLQVSGAIEPASLTLSEQPTIEPVPRWSRRRFVGAGAAAATVFGLGALGWSWLGSPAEPIDLAREYYRKGIEARGQASLIQSEQSVAYLREAIRLDPEFAAAWGALAWGYRGLLEYGERPDADRIAQLARSAAARALELDGANIEARAALLLLRPIYGRWAEVDDACRILQQSSRGNTLLLYNRAYLLSEVGRCRASLSIATELVEREPFWPLAHSRLFQALTAAARLDEADSVLGAAISRWPRRLDFWAMKVRHLLLTGREIEALAFAEDINSRPVEQSPSIDLEMIAARAFGSTFKEKASAASEIAARTERDPSQLAQAALLSAMLDQADAAFAMYDGYYFGRGKWAVGRSSRPATSALFGSGSRTLRRDPRFALLVQAIGLERYWAQSRTLPDYRQHPDLV